MDYKDLKEDEKKIIDTFRKLNSKGKERVFEFIDDVMGVSRYRADYYIFDKTGLKYKC